MQTVSAIPRPAAILGWLGVLPFAALALSATLDGVLPRAAAADALILYGTIILSFMGGAQWGLAMVATKGTFGGMRRRLAISVLPALAAFGLWFLPAPLALLGLGAMFIALLAYDIGAARPGYACLVSDVATPAYRRRRPVPGLRRWAWEPLMRVEAQATIVWLKRDLRTLDCRPLAEAAPWARRSAARCRAGLSIHSKASAAVGD